VRYAAISLRSSEASRSFLVGVVRAYPEVSESCGADLYVAGADLSLRAPCARSNDTGIDLYAIDCSIVTVMFASDLHLSHLTTFCSLLTGMRGNVHTTGAYLRM
jgi:hypothetical protein